MMKLKLKRTASKTILKALSEDNYSPLCLNKEAVLFIHNGKLMIRYYSQEEDVIQFHQMELGDVIDEAFHSV